MQSVRIASLLFVAAVSAGCSTPTSFGETESDDHCPHEGGDPLCDPDSDWCADDSHCGDGSTCQDSQCVPWDEDEDEGEGESATCGDGVLDDTEQCEPSEGDPLCREDCLLRGELVDEFALEEPVAIDALRGHPNYFAVLSNTQTGVAVDAFRPGLPKDGFQLVDSEGMTGLDIALGVNEEGFAVVAALMTDGDSDVIRTVEIESGSGFEYELPGPWESTKLVDTDLGFVAAGGTGELMLLGPDGDLEPVDAPPSTWLDLGAFDGGLALLDGTSVTRLDYEGTHLGSFPTGEDETLEFRGLATTGGRLTLSAPDPVDPTQTLLREFNGQGEHLWEFHAAGEVHRGFAWSAEHTLVGGSSEPGLRIVQLDADDEVLWTVQDDEVHYTDATITEGHVAVALENSVRVYAR